MIGRSRSRSPTRPDQHRLQYRWSNLEADKSCPDPGASRPRVNRTLELDPNREYSECPSWDNSHEQKQFDACADIYKDINYNTFLKNGVFKLTEIELFFLSSFMTRTSSSEWAVVYLGVGNGERFRHLRDEFFPGLSVISFDPFEDGPNYWANTPTAVKNAQIWNSDGTHFIFHVRCFDIEADIAVVKEFAKDKKLLLISDIRGCAVLENGTTLDKMSDLNFQWQAIQGLRPISSLVKFDAPKQGEQYFDYAPGVLLKQVFQNYYSSEVRLMIDGVPSQFKKYNTWELYSKMGLHHEKLRGQIYDSTRRLDCSTKCFDFSFDSEVLWQTLSTYAAQNSLDPYEILRSFAMEYASSLSSGASQGGWDSYTLVKPTLRRRWGDVEDYLKEGRISEAIAVLEADGEEDGKDTDWADIAKGLSVCQPCLAQRLISTLPHPASRANLIQLLGLLSTPFTLVRTKLNGLLESDW